MCGEAECGTTADCPQVEDGCFTLECQGGACVEVDLVDGEPCLPLSPGPCDSGGFGACNADAQCGALRCQCSTARCPYIEISNICEIYLLDTRWSNSARAAAPWSLCSAVALCFDNA